MVLIGFSSIASAQKTEVKVDYMESSALYLEPTQSIMTTPLIADLSVVGGTTGTLIRWEKCDKSDLFTRKSV